jgi:hypothetical protein
LGKNWEKVGKSGKKWEKVGKSGKKWEKVGKSGTVWENWENFRKKVLDHKLNLRLNVYV